MSGRGWGVVALLLGCLLLTAAVVLGHGGADEQRNVPEQEALLIEWKSSVADMVRQHRYREAVSMLRNYLRHAPRDRGMRRLLGKVLYETRRYAEARDVCYVALLHDPDDHVARNNLGVVLAAQDRLPEALRELREAFAGSGQELFIGANLAKVYELAGDPRSAGEVWQVLSGTVRDGEADIPEDALILDNATAGVKP